MLTILIGNAMRGVCIVLLAVVAAAVGSVACCKLQLVTAAAVAAEAETLRQRCNCFGRHQA